MRGTEARRHGGTDALRGLGLVLCLGASVPPCLWSQQRAPARPARTCLIHVDSVLGGTQFARQADGSQNVFSGGGVWARCVNEPTTITSDSLEYFQASGLLRFIGSVRFRDSAAVLDADQVIYWLRQERLHAEGRVYTRNLASGSEMRGPNLDYLRAVPGVRDTLELFATGRPTIRFVSAQDSARGDVSDPFIIVADRTTMRHTSRMWGSGNVTIDRTDLHATADSAQLNLADSVGFLIGRPEIVGRDTARPRADSVRSIAERSRSRVVPEFRSCRSSSPVIRRR